MGLSAVPADTVRSNAVKAILNQAKQRFKTTLAVDKSQSNSDHIENCSQMPKFFLRR